MNNDNDNMNKPSTSITEQSQNDYSDIVIAMTRGELVVCRCRDKRTNELCDVLTIRQVNGDDVNLYPIAMMGQGELYKHLVPQGINSAGETQDMPMSIGTSNGLLQ